MQLIVIRALAVAVIFVALGCNKGKKEKAVVEEVPVAAPADSAVAMTEEPTLESVDGKQENTAQASGEGFSETGRFVVQVAVFKGQRQSGNLVEKLKSSGYPAYSASVEDPTPDLAGTWFRVRIGKFETAKAARDFGEGTLRGLGYDYWVDNKSNDHKVVTASEEASYSEPASSYSSPSTYTPPAEPVSAPSEPVGVPEPPPPAPSEPTPAADAWGEPVAPVPSAPADTAKASDGW